MSAAAEAKKSTSYKQTFRRHRVLLSVPMVLAVLAAAYIIFTHQPTYQATTSLWIDTAPPVASSVGAGSASLPNEPAAAEQSLLTELLTTQAFAVAVAQNSLLGSYLAGTGPLARTAPAALEAQQVTAVVAGPQVLQIGFKGPTPAVTQSTLAAIVRELQANSNGLSAQHDAAAIKYYDAQVQVANQALSNARTQVDAYLSSHPRATTQSDPNLSALNSAENAASQQLAQANTALSQASAARAGGGWLVQVVDPPSTPYSMAYGKKKMLETLLGGLLGGALISLLGTIALTPGKQPEPWEDELADGRASAARRDEVLNGSSTAHGAFDDRWVGADQR
jgi:uncharacterized protein involved in exopolysaccharide biosynthesis